MALPLGGLSFLSGCQQADEKTTDESKSNDGSASVADARDSDAKPEQESKERDMKIHYLEIVTPEVEALCKQYSAIHGITFGDPDMNLGNARTAKLEGGSMIGIRGPLRENETPVIRPYVLVDDVKAAVAAAGDAGAEIALPGMEIPGHGTIAIVIQGGIECGLWQV